MREIEDVKSKLYNLIDSSEDMVDGNKICFQQMDALSIIKDSSNNVDAHFTINQPDELQPLTIENKSGTDVGNWEETIKMDVSVKIYESLIHLFLQLKQEPIILILKFSNKWINQYRYILT